MLGGGGGGGAGALTKVFVVCLGEGGVGERGAN